MIAEIPNFEKINTLNDFVYLYSEPAKDKIKEFISQNKDVLISLEKIKEVDHEGYFEAIKSILDLIAFDYFDIEDINSLVHNFDFDFEDESGVARWNNDFSIVLNKKLFSRNKNGVFNYNINHDIGHEIGHSIIELAEDEQIDFPSEIFDLIDQIDIKTDSEHIQECIENNMDEITVRKERLAEIFGFFLTCNHNRDEFCKNRILSIGNEELIKLLELRENTTFLEIQEKAKNNDKLYNLLGKTIEIYDILSKSWPNLRNSLKQVDLDQHLMDKENLSPTEIDESENQSIQDATSNLAQEIAPESLNTNITNDETKKNASDNHGETQSLGRKNQRSEGFLGLMAQLVKDFANEAPNIKE